MDCPSVYTKPWRQHTADLVRLPPTMLAKVELDLLDWLTAQYYRGEGAIVDAGCFLGGSTTALAAGLFRNSVVGEIHSYDMFATDGAWTDVEFGRFGLKPNEAFENRFRDNVAGYLSRIRIHSGDLLKQTWNDGPVEILFLDICKTANLHDHATRMWFPRLIPGQSILIQQDYGWRYYQWGNVMMEVFKDHFTVLDDVAASRVYLCTKAVTESQATAMSYARLTTSEKLRYMLDAVQSVHTPLRRANLLFSSAFLAKSVGRDDIAKHSIQQILNLHDRLAAAPGDPIGTTVTEFFHYFHGAADGLTDPRQTRRLPPTKRRLPILSRIRREWNRLLGRKLAG